ncbi:hypothetical protein [Cereibacter sphaeroides]|uniref:hypothetical protein n=2 Tax=Cereibacter sphaeroides TaxID=1063 RepID=UPI000191CE4E|nr:hypothetical protein [Cereibacter sphaeroides]ACM04400.1 hypothetical protein RSKD131_4540 [Cereibacter sphaeroides KD131]
MARVVLHIGTHKTATTTIQDMFAHNADLLRQHGVIYPRLSRVAGHHGLVMDWNKLPAAYALPNGSLGTLRQLAAQYGKGEGTVVLSSEEFSRGLEGRRVDFRAVREALAGFESFSIVCVLREQWQYAQSIYLETSKNRVPVKPGLLVQSILNRDMIDGLWTDYNLLYDHLLEAFAPEEIAFLDFEACRRHSGGVVGAMLEHLGCDLPASALEVVHDGQSNVSPLSLPAWAASLIAEPERAPRWLVESTTGAFRAEHGEEARPCLWTRVEFAALSRYAQERNARFLERLAPVQPDFTIRQSTPGDAAIYRDDIKGSFWLRCSRWTYRGKMSAGEG